MIDFLTLYQKILDILPTRNIQLLTDICYEIIGIPISITDITYTVQAITPKKKTGDYYWDYLLDHPRYETDMVVRLYEEGIMQSAMEHTQPYVINWGAATSDFPKIVGVIRINDILEGYIVMQCPKNGITEERMTAMSIIQKACSVLYGNSNSENSMEAVHQKAFIGALFKNDIHTQNQLDLWYRRTHLSIDAPYQIIAVNKPELKEKQVLSYIQKVVQTFTPYQLAIIQNNILYILFYHNSVTNPDTQTYLRKSLKELLKKFHVHCGISALFYHLTDTAKYRSQAEYALEFGTMFHKEEQLYDYKDYYLPAILTPRVMEMSSCNYLSPAITYLQEYDKQHSSNFLETLKCYITSLCHTSNTIHTLHIHRNSLLYRINKIEELTGISLEDYNTRLHLMISFYMIELEKKLHK
ncbi:MAG: helix-turn-helix domain-containing protein [Lachnospiraceae bacterium]|nr:helix-turn-helix domain-containing protein [Lachnospiraceae bacterium]